MRATEIRALLGADPVEHTVGGLQAGLERLVAAGLEETPRPGQGHTARRWSVLAAVAEHDVSLVKLVEGHLDALAILDELGAGTLHTPGLSWGVWAAEPPDAQVTARRGPGAALELSGNKAWCSGSSTLTHGLLTCRGPEGEPLLAAVALEQATVQVGAGSWQAVGMAPTASETITFDGAAAALVGEPGDYLSRPGFWQGGAGIGACWHGGAVGVAAALQGRPRERLDPHAAAHLGALDVALAASAAALRAAAAWIDAHPTADAERVARRVRGSAETAAEQSLQHVGRATGAGPLCLDARHAARAADLAVFVRQSHGERDLEALGRLTDPAAWELA